MIDEERMKILTDGAKYDVSCSSSGVEAKEYERRLGERFFGGNLSFVHAGRKMYFPVKNADDKRLCIRL